MYALSVIRTHQYRSCSHVTSSILHICSGSSSVDVELSLQLLHTALSLHVQQETSTPHWLMDCSPFPLLYVLSQIHDQNLRCLLGLALTEPSLELSSNSSDFWQVLGGATQRRCTSLLYGREGASGVCADHGGAGGGCRGGSHPQQLVQSSLLALQQTGGVGLDGPVPSEAVVGAAL